MTQFQYDAIVKILSSGAPALSDELCTVLAKMISDFQNLEKENAMLKSEIAELKSVKPEIESEEE